MPPSVIKLALYGAKNSWLDVTPVVNALLRHGDGVPVSNRLGGDPLLGVPKVLRCQFADGAIAEYA